MMTSGCRINGKLFRETSSRGFQRLTHRFFIDGKMVSRHDFFYEREKALEIEAKRAFQSTSKNK